MLINILWPDESQFSIDKVEKEIIMSVTATNEKGIYPPCQAVSESVYSYYQRHPLDLPLAGYAVRLGITVPRFFCDNECCEAITFAERMSFDRAIRPSHKTAGCPTARIGFCIGRGSCCKPPGYHVNGCQS